MVKTISMTLDTNSISNAIRQLEIYKRDVVRKTQKLVEMLVDMGVEIARINIIEMSAFFTGELAASIEGYYSPSLGAGFITAGADYAVFVEFGAGVIGQSNPHPAIQNWKYDVNGHGESGWWYYDDGTWHWTKGMPSRPFMFNTAKELSEKVADFALEVFR